MSADLTVPCTAMAPWVGARVVLSTGGTGTVVGADDPHARGAGKGAEQPWSIEFTDCSFVDGRAKPWKPSKSMRRLLVAARDLREQAQADLSAAALARARTSAGLAELRSAELAAVLRADPSATWPALVEQVRRLCWSVEGARAALGGAA